MLSWNVWICEQVKLGQRKRDYLGVENGVPLACLHSYFGVSFQRSWAMNHMINLVYRTAEMSLVSVFIGECVNKWECVNFFPLFPYTTNVHKTACYFATQVIEWETGWSWECVFTKCGLRGKKLDKSFPLTLQLSTSNNRYTNSTTCSSSTPKSSPFLPAVAQKVTTKWEVAISNYLCPGIPALRTL